MAIFRRRDKDPAPEQPARTLLAAALPLTGPEGKQAWKSSASDVQWQKQGWYYYDAVGELHFAFQWLAKAASRAVLRAVETDPETGLVTGPTEDARVQKAAASVLGGPKNLPRLLSLITLHMEVSGESYVLILPQGAGAPDRWEAVTRNSLREQGGTWSYKDPLTGVWTKFGARDRVIRSWESHPDEQTHADCAMRAAIPICAEIEKASQNIAARLDSRIAGNGIFFLPQELDFPVAEGEQADASSFMRLLMDAAEASMANPGTAAAQVPLMAQVPAELIAALANGHVDLSTNLDATVPELRENAFTRLGRTLDMPREIALGQMSDANHWSAWQIEEGTYKIHLEPLLLKLAMVLVSEYFHDVLTAMGVQDPERYLLNWDVTEVIARPDDSEDTKWLWGENLISADYTRSKFGIPDDAIPTEEEERRQLARLLVTGAPTLLENPSVAAELGFEASVPSGGASAVAPPEQAEPAPRALPERQATPPEPDAGLTAAAELVVYDALSRAGGKLLSREYRGNPAVRDLPKFELHTVIPTLDRDEELMAGSFQFTDPVADAFGLDRDAFLHGLRAYVRRCIRAQRPHSREELVRFLGVVDRVDAV